MTDEDRDEKDQDERDGDEKDGDEGVRRNGDDDDDDDDDELAKVPFTVDKVWGSLGEWARSLCRDMRKTSLLLSEFYQKLRPRSSATTASNVVGSIMSCSGRTIRRWRQQYSRNRGDFDEYGRGKYQRDSLTHDDEFCFRARNWAREHSNQRGEPNMTVHDFRQFVNDSLLPEIMKERDEGISTDIRIF